MTLKLVRDRHGGVWGGTTPVALDSGRDSFPTPGQRRLLSSEDRAVIAACVQRRAGGERLTLAQIGALIGRDKSVISRGDRP